MVKSSSKGDRVYKVFIYVVLIAIAITIIVPVAWVFMASIKENSEFYQNPWALPAGFYWQNFVDAWQKASMGSYMLNSEVLKWFGNLERWDMTFPLRRMDVRAGNRCIGSIWRILTARSCTMFMRI